MHSAERAFKWDSLAMPLYNCPLDAASEGHIPQIETQPSGK